MYRQQRKDASWYYVRPNQQAASEEDSASDGEPDNCSSYSSIRENNRSVPAYDIDPQTIYYLGCIHLNPVKNICLRFCFLFPFLRNGHIT